jgi:hypothetical protein
MSRMGPYVAPVFRICDGFFADRAISIAALVVTCKIMMYYHMAYGTFFQESSFCMYYTRISTYWIWRPVA